ncbi:MAG: hypothetical protein GY853_05960 [PVC group bacterium]|nr:hypothetical protein [PVC group bacterium]
MKRINMFKKIIVLLMFSVLILPVSSFSSEQPIPDKYDGDFGEKVMSLDISILTPQQFYELEGSIISLYSGSGGYFLDQDQSEWVERVVDSFKARGIKIEDPHQRSFVIAWSYFNNGEYQKAMQGFKKIKEQGGFELSEWRMKNKGVKNGKIKITEYLGKIPCESTELDEIENDRYLIASYFRGPVYRYDKVKDRHAIVYMPDNSYDWCEDLKFKDGKLFIKLRDTGEPGEKFIFDNTTHKISKLI